MVKHTKSIVASESNCEFANVISSIDGFLSLLGAGL
jgi:hypothetical protein